MKTAIAIICSLPSVVSYSPTGGIIMPDNHRPTNFRLSFAELEVRHQLAFNTYDESELTPQKYIARMVSLGYGEWRRSRP